MKRTVSFCIAAAFSIGFAGTSVAPASADYEYSSNAGSLGTYTSSGNGVTYTFWNQAFVKEINAGFSNDQARTRAWTSPATPYLGYLGAEARALLPVPSNEDVTVGAIRSQSLDGR